MVRGERAGWAIIQPFAIWGRGWAVVTVATVATINGRRTGGSGLKPG